MAYTVKELFYTLQGEGANAGRPAVFCRFTGCNLWSGHEETRENAVCKFCDTDFLGGNRFTSAEQLAAAIEQLFPESSGKKLVVLTGGEPALQVDKGLVNALHVRGFEIAIETNGTVDLPDGIDWVCVSPKANAVLKVKSGSELKLVHPQPENSPADFEALRFDHFFLQPLDGPNRAANTEAAVRYCLENPRWNLSIQTHKILGIR